MSCNESNNGKVWLESFHGKSCLSYNGNQNDTLRQTAFLSEDCCVELRKDCVPRLKFTLNELLNVCESAEKNFTLSDISASINNAVDADGGGGYDASAAATDLAAHINGTTITFECLGVTYTLAATANASVVDITVSDGTNTVTLWQYTFPGTEPADGAQLLPTGTNSGNVTGVKITINAPTYTYNTADTEFNVVGSWGNSTVQNFVKSFITKGDCCCTGSCTNGTS